jgi:hypothetical protein
MHPRTGRTVPLSWKPNGTRFTVGFKGNAIGSSGFRGTLPGISSLGRSAWTAAHACLTMSTEISTAGIAPLFSSQCVVFLSSGQPGPGP